MTGTVKWFDETKGFGFITADDNRDVFVHYSGIAEGPKRHKNLSQGQRVEFRVEQGEKGPKAVDVRTASEPTAACPSSPVTHH